MKSLIQIILALSIFCGCAQSSEEENVPAVVRDYLAIKIPKIDIEDGSFNEVLSFVWQRTRELAPNSGISSFPSGFEPSDLSVLKKRVSYSATDIRVDLLLADLARLFHVEFYVTSVGIVITPAGGTPFPNVKAETGRVFYTYKG